MNPCKKWNKTEESDFSNLTYRAVKWCFTRNAILRSYIIHYSNKRYIYDCEFYRNVLWLYLHEKIVCYRNRFDHLVQKQLLFLNLLLHLGLSLGFFIFFIFLSLRSECTWFTRFDEWSSMRGLKMVRTGAWTMKFNGANHDEPPQWTSLIGPGKSHAFRSLRQKKWKI